MQLAIFSDIHDNVWKLSQALEEAGKADALIGCGDYCSPFVIAQLAAGFDGPIHLVEGNNDGDLFRITRVAARNTHLNFHGEFFEGEVGGVSIAVNHYDSIALPLARSGMYEVVCYGHNHTHHIETVGETLFINPGPLMGYHPGTNENVPSTFVIYDSDSQEATTIEV